MPEGHAAGQTDSGNVVNHPRGIEEISSPTVEPLQSANNTMFQNLVSRLYASQGSKSDFGWFVFRSA